MKGTRREFLGKTVIGAVGAGVALTGAPHNFAVAQIGRNYQAAKHAILLDGVMVGWLSAFESSHVINGSTGSNPLQKIQTSGSRYEEIVVHCGTGMSKVFYDWMKSAIQKQGLRKTGAIVACDYNDTEMWRLEFSNALITEIGFPALDASSKDPGIMTVRFSPESTRFINKPGSKISAAVTPNQKSWLVSNFKLQIAPMDCAYVSKIDAITIRPNTTANTITGFGVNAKPADSPSLAITMAAARADSLNQWYGDSTGGKIGISTKRLGQLDCLTPDLREAIFTLKFANLSISNISMTCSTTGDTERAQLSWDNVDFSYGAV